ncbi:MAG: hypothetical protein DLM59_19800 [Pseudonocardiales bacterium]|nr:MAG: hypothetical protein DLM59_19800 [Pseudonocardiales bacterium]
MRTSQLLTAAVIAAALTGCHSAAGGVAAAGSPTPAASATRPVSTPAPTIKPAPANKRVTTTKPAPPAKPAHPAKPAPANTQVLGPRGFGALRLGMTRDQAVATGSLTGLDDRTCAGATISGPGAPKGGGVAISHRRGVIVITVGDPRVHTPEGVAWGSTLAQVGRAYPGLAQDPAGDATQSVAAVPGNPSAHYHFSVAGTGPGAKVNSLSLVANNQDCFDD